VFSYLLKITEFVTRRETCGTCLYSGRNKLSIFIFIILKNTLTAK